MHGWQLYQLGTTSIRVCRSQIPVQELIQKFFILLRVDGRTLARAWDPDSRVAIPASVLGDKFS